MNQANRLNKQMQKSKRSGRPIKVIAVTSGKGGVGKTQVTANLALALRQRNREVLIFDGDMGLANIDIIFNISPEFNLKHVIDGSKTINEVLCDGPDGVKILPAASGVQELTELDKPHRLNLMDQLDQLDGQFDYVLVDTAAGISDNVMYLNTASQYIFVVVTPEPTSITDAYALMKVLSTRYGEKEFYIITNQTKTPQESQVIFNSLMNATEQFLDSVQLWHLGDIPYDDKVRQSITRQEPMLKYDKGGLVHQAFNKLAVQVEDLETEKVKGGMQFFLKQSLGAGGQ